MNKIRLLWTNLQSSFWFVPLLIVVAYIAIAIGLINAESMINEGWLSQWPRMFGVRADGAFQMLSTLAGAMISVLGIVFSMTLVALALASSQYTSRVLGSFMTSRITQVTLGVFAGIFAYCLAVLLTIRGGEHDFVPGLAVFFAFALALGGIGVLVFFIHHIALSIQASSIIASISEATIAANKRLFPDTVDTDRDVDEAEGGFSWPGSDSCWRVVRAQKDGYIQDVDIETLRCIARDSKIFVRMEVGVGFFVVKNAPLVSLAQSNELDRGTLETINRAYSIGRRRTIEQDPMYGIRQLVDMALKALSPGVNDTSTAVMCVDYLSAILAQLANRRLPPPRHCEDGEWGLEAITPTYDGCLTEAFNQIRESSVGNASIILRMLGALDTLAMLTNHSCRLRAIDKEIALIADVTDRTIAAKFDRDQLGERLAAVRGSISVKVALKVG